MFDTLPIITAIALIVSGITTYLSFVPKKEKTHPVGYLVNVLFLSLFISLSMILKFKDGTKAILLYDSLDYIILGFAVLFLLLSILKMRSTRKSKNDIDWDVTR